MTEKRFVVETVEITDCDTDVSRIAKVITDTKETYSYEDLDEIVHKLNEQQATIDKLKEELELTANTKLFSRRKLEEENEQLRQELQKKQEEERLYANEIVKLNKEAKEVLNFKELGGDY